MQKSTIFPNRTPKQQPTKHHYIISAIIAIFIMLVAIVFYVFSSFSSVQESITELEKLQNVAEAHYEGDSNSLFVKCANGKEFQIELEDTYDRYAPVVADFCR